MSRSERAVNRASYLLARTGFDGVAQRHAPSLGSGARAGQAQIRDHGRLIDVIGDLLGTPLSGDVLSARQLCPAPRPGQPDEIFGDKWNCTPRAPLPRRVGSRIHDDLTDDPPPGVVRITAGNQEPRQRLGHPQSSGL
jgi:hypothetical protein